jgi:hypothetical protein
MLPFNCIGIQIYADQNHAVAHLIPERDGVRSVGRVFDHSREFCLRYTRDELCESERFIIGKIGQRLDIVNDELSDDRGPTVRKWAITWLANSRRRSHSSSERPDLSFSLLRLVIVPFSLNVSNKKSYSFSVYGVHCPKMIRAPAQEASPR